MRFNLPCSVVINREEDISMGGGCGDFCEIKPVGNAKSLLVKTGPADDESLFAGTDMPESLVKLRIDITAWEVSFCPAQYDVPTIGQRTFR